MRYPIPGAIALLIIIRILILSLTLYSIQIVSLLMIGAEILILEGAVWLAGITRGAPGEKLFERWPDHKWRAILIGGAAFVTADLLISAASFHLTLYGTLIASSRNLNPCQAILHVLQALAGKPLGAGCVIKDLNRDPTSVLNTSQRLEDRGKIEVPHARTHAIGIIGMKMDQVLCTPIPAPRQKTSKRASANASRMRSTVSDLSKKCAVTHVIILAS